MKNIVLMSIGLIGTPCLILLVNFVGLRFSFFEVSLTHWTGNSNPFFLIVALALFNLFNNLEYNSDFTNKLSSLSLVVYVLHENLIMREYIRPKIWSFIYNIYAHEYIILQDLAFSFAIFISALILAFIYSVSLQKVIYKVSDVVYTRGSAFMEQILQKIMKGIH